MLCYDYDSNAILVQPFKTRSAANLRDAFQAIHTRLCAAGVRPRYHRLDNECPELLTQYLTSQQIEFQMVPPNSHWRNAAEHGIRTFKNHFIAGLCSTDKDFPLDQWDELIPQAELTLNLLRGFRINPTLSAWAGLFGCITYRSTRY
jgi:hypothetical protein